MGAVYVRTINKRKHLLMKKESQKVLKINTSKIERLCHF